MKAYERYKDSCVAWLGKIPEHWEMRRLKNCIISREAGAWGIDEQNNRNDIICLRVADFDYQNFIFKNNAKFTIRNYDTATIKKLLLANGDILIEKSGGGEKTPVGRAVIFDKNYKAVFANFIEKICTRHDIFSKYFLYAWSAFYESRYVTKYIKQTTGIQNLDITSLFILENFSLLPLSEQNQIAKFLDEKISKINKLISIRQQEISELRELKKAIINKAVTKGDWKRVRLKNAVKLINEKTSASNLKYVGMENIESWAGKLIETEEIIPESISNKFYKGDVLFGKLRPYLAKVFLAPSNGICSSEFLEAVQYLRSSIRINANVII